MLNNAAHFIFDSEHVADIQTRLYGFYMTGEGVFVEPPAAGDDITDAVGAWVLVERADNQIRITQDSIGCFGLFLFREGDYWALSNSFNHLLDFLKTNHTLSLNKGYATALFVQSLCISVYGETMVNEIKWLDRRACISIDVASSNLTIEHRTLDEHSIPIDTEEGLRILDVWHDKWASFVGRAATLWPGEVRVALSGGFDTRIVLTPVLSSEADLQRIHFFPIPLGKKTYESPP